jgi:hypothetical protein
MYSIYGERRNTRSIGLRGSTDDRTSQKKNTHTHKKTQKIVILLRQKILLLLSSFSSNLFLINTMSTSGRSPSTVEQNATRQSGVNIQVTLRPTTNSACMVG